MLTTDAVGGVWHYTLSLAQGLARGGSDCTIVVLGPPPTQMQCVIALNSRVDLIESGLELDWTERDPTRLSSAARQLAGLARRLEADVAHIHTPAFATADWDMPVVAVAHSCVATWWAAVYDCELPSALKWYREAMQEGLTRADAVIAPSASFASDLRDVYGDIAMPHVIFNGLQPSPMLPAVPKRELFVVSAGRLWDIGKNMVALDDAAALQRHPIIAFGQVAGPDGSHFSGRNLSTPGFLSSVELAEAYTQASAFAAPSLYEPFGLAVLEAAAAGLPLLLSDISTFRELWSGAAIFVAPRDSRSWAHAISALMDDEPERARLGAAARLCSSRFSQDKMVSDTHAVHQAVLAKRALSETV